ncbi:MAG TPA: response regulator, partial [Candidatus Polarisedimenticolia bacterium]|nr:response regulator [Candidatus Polarisedimenticolia bacterium]
LREHGYTVATAQDGRSAVEMVRQTRFQVALCDLKMPGISGLETLEQIKAINPDIEIIIITAHGTMESAIESLRKGAFDFLVKPVVFQDLLFSVGKALERRELLERLGLFELSRTIFSTLDPDELFGRVVKSAIQVLRADDASLMLVDENRGLQLAVSTSLQQEILSSTYLAMGERIAGRVALQPEPVVINENVATDERFVGVTPMRKIHASIVCPLTMRGALLGVLNVNRVKIPERYTEHDRRNAMILASLVALALGNARLHKELQVRLQQLSDAQEEAIQTEKMTALGNLLSGVAHELNNPLCGVLGYGQLLLQNNPDPKMQKGIEIIVREGERASKIVKNLLTFARREKPEKKPLGINGVILKTLERKAYDLKVCHIEVKADLEPKLPFILGDFHQMQIVFTNLINNAQQAMFEANGKGTLAIRSETRGATVRLTVEDDGPGVPPGNVRRVFDPFFTTREVGKGPGLGLSVCFAIVRDHAGVIRVASEPGRGASFSIDLPIASPEALQAASVAGNAASEGAAASPATGSPSQAGTAHAQGPRILVADAEQHVQDVLVELLAGMGYRVDTAGTGEGALAKIRRESYDALIADYAMPRLEGRRLLDTLRSEKPGLAQRVIFLASDIASPHLMEFASTSGNRLLGKPFDLETMRAAVRRLFSLPPGEAGTVH